MRSISGHEVVERSETVKRGDGAGRSGWWAERMREGVRHSVGLWAHGMGVGRCLGGEVEEGFVEQTNGVKVKAGIRRRMSEWCVLASLQTSDRMRWKYWGLCSRCGLLDFAWMWWPGVAKSSLRCRLRRPVSEGYCTYSLEKQAKNTHERLHR